MHFYYIYNENEQGIIKLPCNHICCLQVYLSLIKEELVIPHTDLHEPHEQTGFCGFFSEIRMGETFTWSVKYIGELNGATGIVTI